MPQAEKAKVFRNGRSQAVRIPAKYRFTTDEVFIRQDHQSGDLILSQSKAEPTWEEIFAALDAAGVPEDLFTDRDRSLPQERDL